MDSNIRQLLGAAQIYGVEGEDSFLHQAFEQLKAASDRRPSSDGPEPCGQDLYVQCAEIALQYGLTDMTKACLGMYLHRTPPSNQFLCRAYLCHAQLLAPKSAEETSQLDKAVVYVLKAIQFAKENPRYHFLVFNASVLYWQFCRPFLKPNYRQHLSISLHSVVKALDDIDDKDYEWRAQLMLALIECHVDAGRRKEAAEVSKAAAEFTKANVPNIYKQVLQLQVQHHLVDSNKLAKEIKSNGDLTGYYKLARMRLSLEQNDVPDLKGSLKRLLKQFLQEDEEMPASANSRASSVMSAFGRKTPQATMPQTPTSVEESKSKPSSTAGSQQSEGGLASLMTSLVRVASTASEVSLKENGSPPLTGESPSEDPLPTLSELPLLLIELSRLCLEHDQADLASRAMEAIKTCPIKDTGLLLELEFLEAELMVRNLGDKQEMYSKTSVEVRLQCIHRMNEAIQTAIRHSDPNVLQAGCTTMWNVCLPLLQPNLRHHVRKPLTVIAEALENIDSLLILLRCQIHTELARCEEEEEQVKIAMSHLKKALALDDGGQYNERLQHALQRLSLRAELYQQPERMEDQAAMIIEQARTSAESGSIRMKRSLLVRAGQALSPDAFLHVLDSESDTKAAAGTGRGYQGILSEFGAKAKNFIKCVKKLDGHLKRLGNENDRERARLWADVAKTARKQEVWDVCRVAARYCLLYDDERWHIAHPQTASRSETLNESVGGEAVNETLTGQRKKTGTAEQSAATELTTSHSDKDLMRTLADIYFLNAEALIHLLRSEGVKLNTKPIPPQDKRKHPKGYIPKKPEEDEDWIAYCEWIASLSQSATQCFLRAAELGCALGESWIVCNAAAYLWNYNNHLLMDGRHRELIEPFNKLLAALKLIGHARETCLLVNLCNALAIGLMKQWIPVHPKDRLSETPQKAVKEKDAGKDEKTPRKAKSVASHASAKSKTVLVDAEAQDDLKQALEVCEYGFEVTNGSKSLDVVPISVRHPLITTWVQTKQLLLQQISKGLGTEDEGNNTGQRPMTRCLVALEMHSLSGNGIMEFKEQPLLNELANMVEQCKWSEPLVELQVWVRLSELSYKSSNHQLVLKSTSKALRFDDNTYASKVKKLDKHKYTVWQEMLSFASCVLGKSLVNNMHGKNVIRRSALEAFLNAARYGRRADNYELVISASRHYWNTCLPLVCEVIERQLLMQPLNIILDCITATYQASKGDKGKDGKAKSQDTEESRSESSCKGDHSSSVAMATTSSMTQILGDPDDDLTLRAAMYGVLFQALADKGNWEEGLSAMDKAINDMPRTRHRLLIFKHRVMTKAKLGRHVEMDIAKFKDESEDYVALMWHKVALCSKDQLEQLTSHQNAIEALKSSTNDWQKVEYLLRFGEWLYINEFGIQDCVDQVQWAADILLNMKIETRSKMEQVKAKKKRKSKKSGTTISSAAATDTKKSEEDIKAADGEKAEPKGDQGSESEEEINAADFIPVKTHSVIGLSTTNLLLTVVELTSVKQLEHLFRVHVMLALMAGRASPQHKEYCLLAVGFLNRIWQVAVTSAGQVAKEMIKVTSTEQISTKSSAKGKKGKDKGKDQETPREKPKRKGSIDVLPSSVQEWAMYDVPDEIREAFKEDNTGEGVNSGTILKPTLTMYYIDQLVAELCDLSYGHLTFQALIFGEVIARDIALSPVKGASYRLRAVDICLELNLPLAATFHEESAGPIGINELDQANSREVIARWKDKQLQVKKEQIRVKESKRVLTGENSLKKLVSKAFIAEDQKTDIKLPIQGLGKHLSAATLREMWTEQAGILLNQGYYQAARHLLDEAYLASTAFSDDATTAHILQTLAQLAYQEANYGQAMNLLKEAQKLNGDEMFWLETSLLMVDAILGESEDLKRNNKARALLLKALAVYEDLILQRPNKASLLASIKGKLLAKFASVQVDHVLSECRNTMDPKAHRELQTACQGYYQAARHLLDEAYLASTAFSDDATTAHILQTLAQLAYQEANYGQAMNLLKEAQKLNGDEMFWLETSLLMVDAILGESEDLKRNNKARALLLKALAVYEDLILQRPNKASLLASIKGKLLAKFASVQVDHVLSECRNTMDPKAHRELQTACQKFEQSFVLLTETGFMNEAINVLQQHANVLRLFVCDSTDPDLQHSYLLQAYDLLEKAVRLTNESMEDVLGMSPTQQMRGIVLPIQRQACSIKNALVELLIDMFVIHADEARKHKTTEARKPSVIKLVETYIAESPTLTDTEMKWQTLTRQLATKALMELTAAHSLAGPIQELRAKTLYNLGRCLRIIAVHNAPDSPNLWDVQLMGFGTSETASVTKEDGEAEVEPPEEEVDTATPKESIKLAKLAKHAQAEQSTSLMYLAQASEALGQCVQLALKEQLIDLAASASLEMVECCGQYDPLTSSLYLALYQSCHCSTAMKDVLERCQLDPSTSQQAALLHQRGKLLSANLTSNQSRGNLMKSVDNNLIEISEAWKQLKINPNHLELLKDLPANFNLLILQHSEDRSILYGAFLDKPKQTGSKEGKSKGVAVPVSKACVTRTMVDPEALDGLLQRFRQHKFNVMQALLKAEYRRSQQVQRNKMLENLSEHVQHDLKDLSGENELEEEQLQEEFSNLVRAMQEYLRPITTVMEPAFRALDNVSTAAQSNQEEYVVILADKWLMELPLEALPLLVSPSIFSLSRDFSFQILYNRIHQEPESDVQLEEKKKKEAAKAKLAKEKNKSVKILPLERQVPPHCCGVDTHGFKYVIDPHSDCSQTDNENEMPTNIMTQTLNNYQAQFTARWEGIMGNDHVPSVGEWENCMSDNSAFIFYGMERFFSHLHPSKVIPRNMSECKLAILLDLVQTSKSFLRQSKIDVIKTHNDLKHEKPVEMAMLMSMTGIGCLIANQWHCALKDNAATFNTLMKALLETGRTSGQTIRRMFIPHWRPEGEMEDEEGEGEDRDDSSSAKGRGSEVKNGKSDKKGDKAKAEKYEKGSAAKRKVESKGTCQESEDSKPEEEENTEEMMSRHWFNVICYGLPNVMVVQM